MPFSVPVLGLGTALLNEKTTATVKDALDLGYRYVIFRLLFNFFDLDTLQYKINGSVVL